MFTAYVLPSSRFSNYICFKPESRELDDSALWEPRMPTHRHFRKQCKEERNKESKPQIRSVVTTKYSDSKKKKKRDGFYGFAIGCFIAMILTRAPGVGAASGAPRMNTLLLITTHLHSTLTECFTIVLISFPTSPRHLEIFSCPLKPFTIKTGHVRSQRVSGTTPDARQPHSPVLWSVGGSGDLA